MAAPLSTRSESSPAVDVVYCRTRELGSAAIDAALEVLSDDERDRHGRFVFARDRRDYAIAHALLRRLISARLGGQPRDWTFDIGPGGKPGLAPGHLTAGPLFFNISHTRGLVACALTRDAEVGIDVEQLDRQGERLGLARRFFSTLEVAALEGREDAELEAHFIEIWTLKEAYVKAIGQGLAAPLDAFSFLFEGAHGLRLHARPPFDTGLFALYAPMAACRLAVGVLGTGPRTIRLYESLDGTATLIEVAASPLRQTTPR